MHSVIVSYVQTLIADCHAVIAADAAAAVWNTRVTGEFPAPTGSPRVAPTHGRKAAGQLHRGGDVIVLLLWGILATSARECVWPHHICDRLGPPKSRWCSGMRQGDGSVLYQVGPAKLDHAWNVALWVNTAAVRACCIGASWFRHWWCALRLRQLTVENVLWSQCGVPARLVLRDYL